MASAMHGGVTATYDLAYLNAIMKVEEDFQTEICERMAGEEVEDFDDIELTEEESESVSIETLMQLANDKKLEALSAVFQSKLKNGQDDVQDIYSTLLNSIEKAKTKVNTKKPGSWPHAD
uniref:Uncharacterized protein n=1 Tax=Octactis speculum TaxID=3111310 RepID=A0A7S2AVJ9_9STRA|mmetsp:Transcript_16309/g.21949  ORF Transcript_16309/g.21949 Transcript_16309/m.21949 type:complete len:120 (+) Transcript_16309:48-407(+)|eukprot:CAMPEP_0185773014 /NCGR_PEP_ID=MMETSP1174-20130828/72238_1 /TAXON_ID=35687 /ORGANISM="Dictyocha speculum, Strain CCMP1381" /LENGTH=119 /DNA_ID=CAMNT_0028459549 /DNA_START=48 /DNA_END=407 /DNA_ORIENTATION=-